MHKAYINGKFLTQKLSGVQRFANELVKHLPQAIPVIAPALNYKENFAADYPLTIAGNNGTIWWEQVELPSHLRKKNKPLLINLCNAAPVFYRNKISCIHDIAFIRYPQFFSKKFYYYYKLLLWLVIKTSRHIITVSEFSKQELMNHYQLPETKITVIPNASSLNVNSRAASHSPHGKPYFLFVGSMDARKNLSLLLNAYKNAGLKNIDLVIIGAGYKSFNSDIERELSNFRSDPSISFLTDVSDDLLVDYYSHANAVIVPSVYEGFGLPVAEALSFGRPVIAADIPVFREVAGEFALYFDPSNQQQLEHLLKDQQKDPLPHNIKASAYISQKYSWQKSAEKLSHLVKEFSM